MDQQPSPALNMKYCTPTRWELVTGDFVCEWAKHFNFRRYLNWHILGRKVPNERQINNLTDSWLLLLTFLPFMVPLQENYAGFDLTLPLLLPVQFRELENAWLLSILSKYRIHIFQGKNGYMQRVRTQSWMWEGISARSSARWRWSGKDTLMLKRKSTRTEILVHRLIRWIVVQKLLLDNVEEINPQKSGYIAPAPAGFHRCAKPGAIKEEQAALKPPKDVYFIIGA